MGPAIGGFEGAEQVNRSLKRVIDLTMVLALLSVAACGGSPAAPGDLSTVTPGDTIRVPNPPSPTAAASVRECESPRPEWIWCDDFEQDRLASYFEHNTAEGDFVRAPEVGIEGSSGMRTTFRAGKEGAGWLHVAFGRTPQPTFRPVDDGVVDYREIYWRLYLRNDGNWIGGGGHKLTRATSFASANSWAQAMIGHVWSGGSDSTDEYLVLDPASGTDEDGSLITSKYNDFSNLRWLGAARGATPLFGPESIGKWHCIEAHIRLNQPGRSDGVFELWINGTVQPGRDGLNWVGSFDSYGVNAVFLENYWNGGAPKDQQRFLDNFVVSTSRIGCD